MTENRNFAIMYAVPKYSHKKPYKHTHVEPITFAELNSDSQTRVHKITDEFSNGFRLLQNVERSVTFWGSARTNPNDAEYQQAKRIAGRIVKELGYAVVTGGGPGIMSAANCGAYDAGGRSVGLTIKLPMEQKTNLCLTDNMSFRYFFARKVCLAFAAEAYVFFPGGFGTMDELFEVLTLVQTHKMDRVPVILVGVRYWKQLEKFIKGAMLKSEKIDPEDLNLYTITDDEDKIIRLIRDAPLRK